MTNKRAIKQRDDKSQVYTNTVVYGREFAIEPPVHRRKKRGGQLKTWKTTSKEDLARLSGPAVYGLRRWNQDWMTIGIA